LTQAKAVLLYKLIEMQIPPDLIKLIKSYLAQGSDPDQAGGLCLRGLLSSTQLTSLARNFRGEPLVGFRSGES